MKRTKNDQPPAHESVRCAIYTRKSSEEGLEQEFNSLDAQRESAEAFIKSQVHERWECLPDHYDDGGFSGGNMDRPALQRLLADIEAGKVDCVVVYKVDRLSRSLLDFVRMMELFENYKISFVAFTQQINTATSMGRLMLNVLMSFAQFERELVSERTRDKIAAARRKGKWAGGHPLLGYNIDPKGFKLVVNEDEAERVRAIYKLYLELESLLPVVVELERRGWRNKRWTTRKGRERGGKAFTRTSLYKLLTNVAYLGRVKHKTENYAGEPAGIVEPAVWQQVQAILQRNHLNGGALVRNKFGALLKGIMRRVPCDSAMIHSHTTRKGNRVYRYYTCCGAQKRGWHTCPSKSIPAGQIEQFVVDRIRCIGEEPALLNETLTQARAQSQARIAEVEAERRGLERELGRWHAEINGLMENTAKDLDKSASLARLADLQERICHGQIRLTEISDDIHALGKGMVDEREVREALAAFDPVWGALTPREQARLIHLLVVRVDYDGGAGKVSITFHATGFKTLADEVASQSKERIA